MIPTPEQIANWVQEQNRLVLRTDKVDWKRFKRAARKLYRSLRIHERVPIYKVKSPFVAAQVLGLFRDRDESATVAARWEATRRRQVFTPQVIPPEQTLEQLLSVAEVNYGATAKEKAKRITDKIGKPTANRADQIVSYIDHIYLNLRLWDDLDAAVRPAGLGVVGNTILFNSLGMNGYLTAGNYRIYGIAGGNDLIEVEESVPFCLLNKKYVLAVDRPDFISVDQNGRLHNNDRMAVRFRDGWGVHAIHGVRVPSKYVERSADDIRIADVFSEPNAQVRMAVISKVGFVKLMKHMPQDAWVMVDRKGQDAMYDLLLPDMTTVRVLHVHWREADGEHETMIPVPRTDEQFQRVGPFVPDNINSFEEVRWWTFGLRRSEIKIMGES